MDGWTRGRLAKVTLLCWVVTFGLGAVWGLAAPLWSTPDSPAHDLMAYHAVRDLTIQRTDVYASGVTSNALVEVPRGLLKSSATAGCYAFHTTPADCLRYPTDDGRLGTWANPAGRNMPTYYLATGWPSRLVPIKYVVWADRLAAVAISSFFLAWGASAALTRRRRSIALTGVAMSATPMVLYFTGAVNPNSLEITAGIALAACSVAFLQEDDPWLAHVMFRRAMVAATVMVTIRMLAPVWVLAWAAAFVLLATRRHWRHMLSRRGVPWLALPVVGALFDVVWTVTSGVTDYQAQPKFTNTFWENVALSRSQIDRITMRQQIGTFGWLDTPLHPELYAMFTWASLLLLVVAGTRLRRRELAAVGLLVVAQYVLPILLQAMQYNTNGPVWQGRYTLPLTVAVPIFTLMLSAPRWEGSRLLRSATWLFPAALAVLTWVHFAALTVELRRNVSGLDGPSFLHGVWQPPLGSLTLVVTQAGLLCVVVGAVVVLTAQERRPAVRRSTGGAAAEEEARHGRRAGLGIGASGSLG